MSKSLLRKVFEDFTNEQLGLLHDKFCSLMDAEVRESLPPVFGEGTYARSAPEILPKIAALFKEDKTPEAIAQKLGLIPDTVRWHLVKKEPIKPEPTQMSRKT